MTYRLMTPYCAATQAVAALLSDSAFTLRLLKAFAVPGAKAPPVVPMEAVGGLSVTAGESPFDLSIENWAEEEA